MGGLVWKSVTENSTLQVLSFVFLIGALLAPPDIDPLLAIGVGLLLLVALGTAAYAPVEKQGLDCVLYQHPVPRTQLFLAKTGAALVPVLAVWGGVVVLLDVQTAGEVTAVLAYAAFAYAGAVLMTITFERPIIAMLATICLLDMSLLLPIGLGSFMRRVAGIDFTIAGAMLQVSPSSPGGDRIVVVLGLAVPSMLLAVGSLWAARRMATDPAVLTGAPADRLRSFAGLYAVVVAVSAMATLLWWREPLAMIW